MAAPAKDEQKEASKLSEQADFEEAQKSSAHIEPRASAIKLFVSDVGTTVRKSLHANRVPSVMSLLMGAALLALYYGGGDALKPGFESLADIQTEGGILFSVVSTGLFAGLLPTVLQAAVGLLPRPYSANLVFNVVLWSCNGAVVNRLYFFQAWLFGDEADPVIVLQKVLFDQFVWNPFIFGPFLSLILRWRDYQFSLQRWREVTQPRAWALAYCSMMITCWGTWIPGTSVVYSFPSDLQMPAFNVIIMMYSSLVSLVSQGATGASDAKLELDDAGPPHKKDSTIADADMKQAHFQV